MASERSYKTDRMKGIIADASQFFDVVRLVDPISMTVYVIGEDGELHAQPDGCYHVWNKTDRCENCVSARCFMEDARYSKFEFIDNDIYHVVAQPVNVDGQKYVLEVVTASNDNVLLSAFGNNAFVDRITTFNHKVYTDDLTGLANRRFLDERLGILIDRSAHDGTPLAVVMMDIDDFKNINDGLGHVAGDAALGLAGDMLKEALQPGSEDILARYGGDEFIAVLQGLTEPELEQRLQAIKPIEVNGKMTATLSVGAYYQEKPQAQDVKSLIHRADQAMYGIKAEGKNSFAVVE